MTTAAPWMGSEAMGYANVESLLDDVSRQMASSNLTRHSRHSIGQRPGGSMRIVKPSSTSNSPRSSIGLGRRRTVMDGLTRRRPALVDQRLGTSGGFVSHDGVYIPAKSSRPVSWHPTSHLPQQQFYHSAPVIPTTNDLQGYDPSHTPIIYSGYTSPSSVFSPVSMPFTGYEQHTFPYSDLTTSYPTQPNYMINQAYNFAPQPQYNNQSTETLDPLLGSHLDWNTFATNGFDNHSTAPPTPENFLPIQHPMPAFPAEDSIPYHPLSDSEGEGDEVLVGMGLYDSPEVSKTSTSDPHLDNYRALMMSQLLGSAYLQTEPTGKGLKLEETWNPPASDDEKDGDDDEQDGEGEDDEEAVPEGNDVEEHNIAANPPLQASTVPSNNIMNVGTFVPRAVHTNFAPRFYDGNGWL